MIYPALVAKSFGFIQQSGNSPTKSAGDSSVMRVQFDNGEIADVSFLPTDKDLSSLGDYINVKATRAVKENKVKTLMSELMFSSDPLHAEYISKEEQQFQGKPNAKQLAVESLARKVIFQKNLIRPASIIRCAFAQDKSGGYNSKSIYVEEDSNTGEKQYSNAGIYSHALLDNQIPIEIKHIRKGNRDHVGYLSIQTSLLISKGQVFAIIDHLIRTLEKKMFFPTIQPTQDLTQEVRALSSVLSSAKEQKNSQEAISILQNLKNLLNLDKRHFKGLSLSLPFLITLEDFKTRISQVEENKGKSPVQAFRDALVNLNFSKENPDAKKDIKRFLLTNFLLPMIKGGIDLGLQAVYNLPPATIDKKSSSWGFMVNNVDFKKLTFSKDSQLQMFEACEKYVLNGRMA